MTTSAARTASALGSTSIPCPSALALEAEPGVQPHHHVHPAVLEVQGVGVPL